MILSIKRATFVFILCSYWALVNTSQATEMTKSVDRIEQLELNDNISLTVYIPPRAKDSKKRYPTMYVMDGQHYFYNAIAYQKTLRHNVNMSPEFIVVGINLIESEDGEVSRWSLLNSNKEEMINTLAKRVFPLINKHYPSNDRRMYFGWQFGASFGLDFFNAHPNLVEGYFFASDPMFDGQKIKDIEASLNTNEKFNNYFYLTLGTTETHATKQHNELTTVFSQFESKGIKWKYTLSENYNHQTTPLDSFTNGLNWYFADFPDMTFYSIADINNFGGVKAVKEYFVKRGIRYNLPTQVGDQAKFSMFRHAAQENDWPNFQSFEKEMGTYQLTHEASPYWFNLFSKFFAQHDIKRAERTFNRALKVHPGSHGLWASYAEFKQQLGELEIALGFYQNALKNAEKSSPHYEKYLKKIVSIEKS